MAKEEAQQAVVANKDQTPDISEQLGTFRKNLIAQGIPEEHANAMTFQLFSAYINGDLDRKGQPLGDFE